MARAVHAKIHGRSTNPEKDVVRTITAVFDRKK